MVKATDEPGHDRKPPGGHGEDGVPGQVLPQVVAHLPGPNPGPGGGLDLPGRGGLGQPQDQLGVILGGRAAQGQAVVHPVDDPLQVQLGQNIAAVKGPGHAGYLKGLVINDLDRLLLVLDEVLMGGLVDHVGVGMGPDPDQPGVRGIGPIAAAVAGPPALNGVGHLGLDPGGRDRLARAEVVGRRVGVVQNLHLEDVAHLGGLYVGVPDAQAVFPVVQRGEVHRGHAVGEVAATDGPVDVA